MKQALRLLSALVVICACGPMARPQSECKLVTFAYQWYCSCTHQWITQHKCSEQDSSYQCNTDGPGCGHACCGNWYGDTCQEGTCITAPAKASLLPVDSASGLSENGGCPGSLFFDLKTQDKQPNAAKEPAGPSVRKDKPRATATSS